MGYYINPKGESKEQWLMREGEMIEEPSTMPEEGYTHICLVDNGWMTAAGIAYCLEEQQVFAEPDGRPKFWFKVLTSRVLAEFERYERDV